MNEYINLKVRLIITQLLLVVVVLLGGYALLLDNRQKLEVTAAKLQLDEQQATVQAIKKVSPAVVSISVIGNAPAFSLSFGGVPSAVKSERKELGSGTGFIITADGLIITNKHVVNSVSANDKPDFRVTLSTGKRYYAQLIGRDPLNDLALLKIFDKNLPYVELGDSSKLEPGISVIAIGNALGQYQNSVTKGIVSGLGRDIFASDTSGNAEALGNVIQTDAEINLGNSGGPLIDLDGKVIGINVATDASARSIGFAIPINDAKPVIKSAREIGRIVRPRLGIRYLTLTPELVIERKLPRSNGALVNGGENGESGILPNSPAAQVDIRDGDIIFEIDGKKLDQKNTLLSIAQNYKPGQKIGLKIQRGASIITRVVILDEFKSE